MPKRIQRRRTKGWRMPEGAVAVTRPTEWGSPFPISKATQTEMGVTKTIWMVGGWEGPGLWFKDTKPEAQELSVRAFREWVNQPQQRWLRDRAKLALKGRDLACWCTEGDPCHGEVWLEIANS